MVRIVERAELENFMSNWKLHNSLQPDRLEQAGRVGKITSVGFYHGGDELYEVEGIPGIWHERCLEGIRSC
jgi:hypothetical protein